MSAFKLKLSCRSATELVSQGRDRPLRLKERIALRFHLAICKNCTEFNRQMRVLRSLAQRFPEEIR